MRASGLVDHYCSVCISFKAYRTCDRPKEAFMGGHPFPEIPCTVCRKPVDLTIDLSADENGKAVHQECYIKRVMSSRHDTPAIMSAQ